jgi:hypothetical protein
MSNIHWNYFLAIEEDLQKVSRFIEFNQANFSTYSIELARILMASTQEIDVLLKQVCAKFGDNSNDEQGYRTFFAKRAPAIQQVTIVCPRYGLTFVPFENWATGTPEWWTANNKVKHERHTHFTRASLKNALAAVCGLYVSNFYHAENCGSYKDNVPAPGLLAPADPSLTFSSSRGSGYRLKDARL